MKKIMLMILMLATTIPLSGAMQRIEREPIAPLCEVIALPSPLAEYEEPARYLARMAYGEANTLGAAEQAAAMWCVLNRVDAGWGTIVECVTAPEQFRGYAPGNPVTPEQYALALDVLARWQAERAGCPSVGRVLPKEYLYFSENNGRNEFRACYYDYSDIWGWSLESPYEEE